MQTYWCCGPHHLSLVRPLVMGIVNVTPDSFSDGGYFFDAGRAADHGRRLIDEGADILDIGGESSRPGSEGVSEAEELRRVLPVIDALAGTGVPISVDTVKPGVMRAALAAGAVIINDIAALQAPGALEVVGAGNAGVVLMHMQGEPATMQQSPHYGDVVSEVTEFLRRRIAALEAAGVARARIAIDPGFGFGKRVEHNVALMRKLDRLAALGCPVLVGLSRKSTLGAVTGRQVADRLPASLAAAVLAVSRGARIVRVHDVAATRDALAVWQAVEGQGD